MPNRAFKEEPMGYPLPSYPLEHLKYKCAYKRETDEQIFARLRCYAAQLGRAPHVSEVPASSYLKQRFGPWPRLLERAGLKEITENYRRKQERREQKKMRKLQNKKI